MVGGIYGIKHRCCCGKVYIGSSFNIQARFRKHIRDLRANRHSSPHVQHVFDKHGEDGFFVDVLELSELVGKPLRMLEQTHIDSFLLSNPRQLLMNATTSAINPTDDPVVELRRLEACRIFRENNKELISKTMSERNKDPEFSRIRLENLRIAMNNDMVERTARFTERRNTEEFKKLRYEALYESLVEPVVFVKLGQEFKDRTVASQITGYVYSGIGGHINGMHQNCMWLKKSTYDMLSSEDKEHLRLLPVRKSSSAEKYLKALLEQGKIEEKEEGKYEWVET